MSTWLSADVFKAVVKATPLVAIDLIVRDSHGRLLFGLRKNAPAKGSWFVPGGRIRKGESFAMAFERLTKEELGVSFSFMLAQFLGTYEHFYADDFEGDKSSSTHYVVLAYAIDIIDTTLPVLDAQHHDCRWVSPEICITDPSIHTNCKPYAIK
jgi:colanic acid biosynthesis protein WcaH